MNKVSPWVVPSQRFSNYKYQMFQSTKRAPVYPLTTYSLQSLYQKQQKWSQDMSDKLIRFLDYVTALSTEAKQFDQEQSESLVNSRVVQTTDPESITVQAQPKAAQSAFSIEVSKLAKQQLNISQALPSSSKTSVSAGINSFRIKINGKEQTFSLFISSLDTNQDVLSRIAETINQNTRNVVASVTHDKAQDTSTLEILSNDTGLAKSFSIYDIEGDSIQATGLGIVSQEAEDARYTLDGVSHTSATNQLRLGDNQDIAVSLQQVTTEPVEVSVTANTEKIVTEMKVLVNRYNQFDTFLNTGSLSSNLQQSWRNAVQKFQSKLSDLGIGKRFDGSLYVDEQKLGENITDHFAQIQSALSGPNGFATLLQQETEKIQKVSLVQAYQTSTTNPYEEYTLSNLFLRHAAAVGLYMNTTY